MSTELPVQRPSLLQGAAWRARRAATLFEAFRSGVLLHHTADIPTPWPITLSELGLITLDSGEVVVADPYISEPDTAPFTQRIDPGEHRLLLATAQIAHDHRRIAGSLLMGRATPILTWALALQPGQLLDDLEDDDSYYGFPVDAGTACIASPDAFAAAATILAADGGMLKDPLSNALFTSGKDAAIAAPFEGAEPVALLMTGWGDGSYPVWLGLDEAGELSVACVDFLLNAETPPVPSQEPSRTVPGPGDQRGRASFWRRLRRQQRNA